MNGLITEKEVSAFLSAHCKPSPCSQHATINSKANTAHYIESLVIELNQPGKVAISITADTSTTNEERQFSRQDVLAHHYQHYTKPQLFTEKRKLLEAISQLDQSNDWDKYAILTSRCNAINIRLRELNIGE